MISLFDAGAWLGCIILLVRGVCVLNRMGWRHWSWFSFPVIGLVMSSAYVVINGREDKEYSYPVVIMMIVALCLLDKRRTKARKDRDGLSKT